MNKLSAKIAVWHALVALTAWQLFSLSDKMQFNGVTGLDINLPSFGWFLWTVAFIGLGYVLFKSRIWPITISALVGILFLLFLGFTWLNVLAVIIFWLCNVWAYERAREDIAERLKLNMTRTLSVTLLPVVLGFFIMASFAAYQSNFAEKIKDANQLPGQSQVFFHNAIDKFFGPKLGPANSKQRQQAVNEVSTGTYKSINDFLAPYFKWAPPVLAFGLLIILWGLSWIFVYAGVFGALLIYWILKKTRVVRIEERDVKAEVLVI
jgi:hypothetical protein